VLIYRIFAKSRKVALPRSWLALLLIAAVIGIAVIPLAEMGAPMRIASELVLICLIGPLVIYFGQRMEPPRAFAKILVWLGSISYALYLLHWPIYTAALRIPAKIGMSTEQTAPMMGFVILVVSVAGAAIAERYYDRPVRKWLGDVIRRYRERRGAKASDAAAVKSAGQAD
jgi:peptidoglycan/LPS O-acetylase OafA/YrhL